MFLVWDYWMVVPVTVTRLENIKGKTDWEKVINVWFETFWIWHTWAVATKEYTCMYTHTLTLENRKARQGTFRRPQCIGSNWNHRVGKIPRESKDRKGLKLLREEQRREQRWLRSGQSEEENQQRCHRSQKKKRKIKLIKFQGEISHHIKCIHDQRRSMIRNEEVLNVRQLLTQW